GPPTLLPVLTREDWETLRFGILTIVAFVNVLKRGAATREDGRTVGLVISRAALAPNVQRSPLCAALFADVMENFDAACDRFNAAPGSIEDTLSAAALVLEQVPPFDSDVYRSAHSAMTEQVLDNHLRTMKGS